MARRPPGRRRRGTRITLTVAHLYFVWVLTLFDLQFFLAAYVAQPLIAIINLGYPPLILMIAFQAPVLLTGSRTWTWYPPLALLLGTAIVTMPMAANFMYAKLSLTYLLIYYAIAVGTAVYIRNARQAKLIVHLMWLQFAWYSLFAGAAGRVPWHPTLGNHDGFGSMMVGGVGLAYWFGMAARKRWLKTALYLLAVWCVLGVVASYARAAFLSLVALGAWIWLRSPRKMVTAMAGVAGAFAIVIAASLFFDPGFFYNEIMSAFEEGTDSGTGEQRWELWKVAFKVWLVHPIIGVGGGNFGAFAAGHFRVGELEAFPMPSMLYGFNLHNAYVQIIVEYGLVGIFAFGWCVWDFWKKNSTLRKQPAMVRWDERSGGTWNLRYLAFGLEAMNVANLLGGIFYASLFMPWFFVVWAANRMLWSVTRPDQPEGPRRKRGKGG